VSAPAKPADHAFAAGYVRRDLVPPPLDRVAAGRLSRAMGELIAARVWLAGHLFGRCGDPLRRAALRTREELREHFTPTGAGPALHRRAANITIHQTTDPEVIVAEFEYQGTVAGTGEPFALPGIFVLRVRNGEIVSSRDYFDHLTAARVRGQLEALIAAVR